MRSVYPVFFTRPSELTSLNVENATFAGEGETVVSLVDIDSGEYRRKIDTRTGA